MQCDIARGCGISLLLMSLGACSPTAADSEPRRQAEIGTQGMVVSVSPLATQVGVDILKAGGNAVDASIAVAFTMAVTYPQAGNIGGGGFMLVLPAPGKKPVCIEYREKAPKAATRTLFSEGADPFAHDAVGVPGTVRGLELAHQQYGTLPWKDLLAPAIALAENGFPLTAARVASLNLVLASPRTPKPFRNTFGKPGANPLWDPGDTLRQPELAETLKRIAQQGPDAFYTGKLADLLVQEMQRGQGLITKEDLANYTAKVREPIHGTYRGLDVYGPPPPSSGGICLVQMLNVLENFDLTNQGRWSARTNHLLIETMRRSYFDRARYLGDADFVEIPAKLTSKAYAKKLAQSINPDRATPSEVLAEAGEFPLAGEGNSTTHFSIMDAKGMAVSNTYTLEASYGTRIVVPGAGYLLNNEMTDFNHRPGVTNRRGAIGTEANLPAPGKRMLSSQTPTLVLRDGKAYLITGSPGGRTIINTVVNVLVNSIDFGMSPVEAVDAPRLHHAWFPDRIRFEGMETHPLLVQKLRALGHTVDGTRQGDAHSIWVDPESGKYHGVADQRIDGRALGY